MDTRTFTVYTSERREVIEFLRYQVEASSFEEAVAKVAAGKVEWLDSDETESESLGEPVGYGSTQEEADEDRAEKTREE